MKIMSLVLLLFAVLGQNFAVHASEQISDAVYLRKLSFHLRGTRPSFDEYDALARAADKKSFFNQKIGEYLNTTEAQDRMVFRLSEKFQIRPPNIGHAGYSQVSDNLLNSEVGPEDLRDDAMTDLFKRLISENLPWDALLTAKTYNLYPAITNGDTTKMTDFNFFRVLNSALPYDLDKFGEDKPVSIVSVPMRFGPDDPLVGGILTTARFLSRYNTTDLNKNRRRAAAVFRIFLCDPMFPIIPPPPDKKAAELNQAFPDDVHGQTSSLFSGTNINDSSRHGFDPKCASCHTKLDPMGLTFQNIGMALSAKPSAGYLTYTRANGEKLKTYLRGVGDLGREVTRQPEYVSCQVDWLWKQFIGKDVTLTEDRKTQVIQAFESVGRRTDDFIKLLVTSPEFRRRPQVVEQVTFSQVAPLLKRCDNCHKDEFDYYGDNLSTPMATHKMLMEVLQRVTLPDSSRKKMPEDWAKWDGKDLEIVRRWLREGAVDDQGKPRLTPADLGGFKWN